jgi:hypothetical protein
MRGPVDRHVGGKKAGAWRLGEGVFMGGLGLTR